ncbi:hypothetical protein [Candidatus Chloroploca asiatica]|uniref:Glycosyltransferase RgtA/B/C/D-like domain-containing protein n=1 Tax=Candidatus Chloroploca asiatica TaxID=1506545 RepID=A0A2H3KRK1_9CHLR|nr:hypothetical protein [Candidatus Chloroploca asiatica]PDW01105.1 hypothetical protein A9Q02_08090 [Candidatus Chloroploca asiatica]
MITSPHPRSRTFFVALTLLLSGWYLLTMSGHTYSPDEETMLAVTRSLLEQGDVVVRNDADAPFSALRPGREGQSFSPYGVLPSLLALPLYALGSWFGGSDPATSSYTARFAVMMLNGPITAATAALIAWWALKLGARHRWAVFLALLYGLATFAWPYARTFFSEPVAALLLLLAAERAWSAGQFLRQSGSTPQKSVAPPRLRRAHSSSPPKEHLVWVSLMLFCSGLAAGLLPTTRIAAGVALPILGLYLLWMSGEAWRQQRYREAWLVPFAWGVGLVPGLAILVWYNLARFGTPFASGYASEANLFTAPLTEGLYGLLVSPGKSLFLFAPPVLLALPGAVVLWRRGHREAVLLGLGLFLSHLLLYARWGEWEGGGVWGPRFLLPAIPPLILLAAGLWQHNPGKQRSPLGHSRIGLVILVGVIGFVGNLGGVLFNFSTYVVLATPTDKVYTLPGSPLLGHWRMLTERWSAYTAPAPICRLGDGWYASEDPGGALLPRRTGAQGKLRCTTAGTQLTLTLDDRRPAEAPTSQLTLWLNEERIGTPPTGTIRTYRLLVPPGKARLKIEAVTWNPQAIGFSERNDELGPQLMLLQGRTEDGGPITIADTAIAPLPTRPRPRWAWYYDPPNQHLVDHWAWYLPRTELTGPRAWTGALLIIVTGSALLGSGIRLQRQS